MKPGQKLGALQLVVLVEPPRWIKKREAWGLFRCDCGKEKRIRVAAVTGGYSRSCGCAARKAMRAAIGAHRAELIANAGTRNPWR